MADDCAQARLDMLYCATANGGEVTTDDVTAMVEEELRCLARMKAEIERDGYPSPIAVGQLCSWTGP